jgi:Zn ribbon nucleic-acid-binding protein
MTKQTFTAFGATRTSDSAYTWASIDQAGTVRFHLSRPASPGSRRIAPVEVVTAAEGRRIAAESKAAHDAKMARWREDDVKITACMRAGGDWRALKAELDFVRATEIIAAEKAARASA